MWLRAFIALVATGCLGAATWGYNLSDSGGPVPTGPALITIVQLTVIWAMLASWISPRGLRAWLYRCGRGDDIPRLVTVLLVTLTYAWLAPGPLAWLNAHAFDGNKATQWPLAVLGAGVLLAAVEWRLAAAYSPGVGLLLIVSVAHEMSGEIWMVPALAAVGSIAAGRLCRRLPRPGPRSAISLAVAAGVAATMFVRPLPLSALTSTDGWWRDWHENWYLDLMDHRSALHIEGPTITEYRVHYRADVEHEHVRLRRPLRSGRIWSAWGSGDFQLRPHVQLRPFAAGWLAVQVAPREGLDDRSGLLVPAIDRWFSREEHDRKVAAANAWLARERRALASQTTTQRVRWDAATLRVDGGHREVTWSTNWRETARLRWNDIDAVEIRRLPGLSRPLLLVLSRASNPALRTTLVLTPGVDRRLLPELGKRLGQNLQDWQQDPLPAIYFRPR